MPDFAYTARDLSGNRVEGTLAAGNEREVLATLSASDLFPLKVPSAERPYRHRRVRPASAPR